MSNLRAREPLERAGRLFLERPAAARNPNPPATAVWRGDGLGFEISGPKGEKATTDMPATFGGDGTGPSPGWLFRAAMAGCFATAIAMRAALLGIELQSLEVNVESESDSRGFFGISGVSTALGGLRMSVKIGANGLNEEQLRDLVTWAEAHSTVGCTLREHPPVAVEISVM